MRVLLIVYDNQSYIHYFPQGISAIAAILLKNGHNVEIYNQDLHHYPESHLTQYLDDYGFDVVGLSFVAGYYQYKKALKISEAINKSKNRPFYIIGGHGPTPEPIFFMEKTGADAIVMGEGEETIIELLQSLSCYKFPWYTIDFMHKKSEDFGECLSCQSSCVDGLPRKQDIKGIAYRDGDKIYVNERRPLIKDIDKIPMPAYELFPMEYYRLLRQPNCDTTDFCMPMLSGRGCKFNCNFCYRMDKGFRPRSNESIMEEIELLQKDYGITYIAFSDELLMSSEERVVSLCDDFIKNKLKFKWYCNGRLNFATKEVLGRMKDAGCVFINYGIESFDDTALKNMNKVLTTKQIVAGIENTLQVGISPGFNIIFGNIGETAEILQKDVDFLLDYDDGAQLRTIRVVTPYPGSALYYYAIEHGMLKDCEDFYENKHVNSDLLAVNFTDMPDDEFHKRLYEANTILVNNYFTKKESAYIEQMDRLYNDHDTSFRGFRQT